MIGSNLAIPLSDTINVVTLTQSLIFAAFFLFRPAREVLSTWFLVAAFLILASIKADQLYQMLGGLQRYPEYGFMLTPLQAAMTPALYLFVTARTTSNFRLRRGHLWHLTPVFLMAVYLTAIYYRFDAGAKAELVNSGELNNIVNRFLVPILGDGVQLAYLVAAYRKLQHFGVSLKTWFAHVENRDLVWMKRLLTVWGAIFVIHAAWTLASSLPDARPAAYVIIRILDVTHLAIANLLALLGAADVERRLAGLAAMPRAGTAGKGKYAASGLSAADRAALFRRAEATLMDQQLYLQPELTLNDLASAIGAPARDVSEAVNGAGEQSFFEFVNRARIRHVQERLITEPHARILDIAFQSGFNSKSAFNGVFKKSAGVTPTQFRREHVSSRETNRPSEKPAP
jgi:AraC-like DNA-binding protein